MHSPGGIMMQLAELKPGKHAIIIDLSKIDRVIRRRLLDLGVTEGESVCCKRFLPFGGPCMFEVHGQSIGIRRRDAGNIDVECE